MNVKNIPPNIYSLTKEFRAAARKFCHMLDMNFYIKTTLDSVTDKHEIKVLRMPAGTFPFALGWHKKEPDSLTYYSAVTKATKFDFTQFDQAKASLLAVFNQDQQTIRDMEARAVITSILEQSAGKQGGIQAMFSKYSQTGLKLKIADFKANADLLNQADNLAKAFLRIKGLDIEETRI